ncbi:MAG: extracellular solute-binding protein, partial [Methanobacteriota archaeon]
MTTEIEFSIMAPKSEGIQPLLDQFEAETGIRVRLRLLLWDSAFSMFVRSALYNDSPDVSELGTTWVGDLIGMNALRPFNSTEIVALGKPGAFLPQAWRTVSFHTTGYPNERVWSIPWVVGARLLFYRKDLLEEIGIDAREAFSSNSRLADTIRHLSESGVRVPWMVPTGYTHTNLHNISSWVWGAGGDFLSPDGKRITLVETSALKGLCEYFSLVRYLAPEVRGLNGLEPDDYLLNHPDAAAIISGPWLFTKVQAGEGGRIGVTLPPGPSFVGGSNLIIWKSARNPEAAFKLVRFLTQTQSQTQYARMVGLLPARLEAQQAEPYASDPNWQT